MTLLGDAKEFLASFLTNGPVAAIDVLKRGVDQLGYSRKKLCRGKKRLGVKSIKRGFDGEWCWKLPH